MNKTIIKSKNEINNLVSNIKTIGVLNYLSKYHLIDTDIFKKNSIIICGFNNSMIKDLILKIKDNVKIVAIIDDNYINMEYLGIKIVSSKYLDKIDKSKHIVMSGVFSQSATNYFKTLAESKGLKFIEFGLALYFLNIYIEYEYYNNIIEYTVDKINEITKLFSLFNDKKSIKTLYELILYRLTLYKKHIKNVEINNKEQYFDREIIYLSNNEVFVDCGAFDGDTFQQFTQITYNRFKEYYAFEPDLKNYQKLKILTKNDSRVRIFNKGLWSETKTIFFSATANHTSRVNDIGNETINVVALDDLNIKPSFIKIDIEGSEMEALKGMTKTIIKYKPNMAISIYHKPSDLLDIINYVLNLKIKYRIYLRHYSNDIFDTIAYFIKE